MVVTLLPVYRPSIDEAGDPALYADNVRRAMAAHLGAPLSAYDAKALNAEYYGAKAPDEARGDRPGPLPLARIFLSLKDYIRGISAQIRSAGHVLPVYFYY